MRYTIKRGNIVPAKLPMQKESSLHKNCITWFDIEYPKLKQLLFHIPNGGTRNVIEAVNLKRMGTRRGVPDLFLSIPNNKFFGLYIELKTLTGEQSDEQKKFESSVIELGYAYVLVRDLELFTAIVRKYLSSTRFAKKIPVQLSLK